MIPIEELGDDVVRLGFISDTHQRRYLPGEFPKVDALFHMGDFSDQPYNQSYRPNPENALLGLQYIQDLFEITDDIWVNPGNHDHPYERAIGEFQCDGRYPEGQEPSPTARFVGDKAYDLSAEMAAKLKKTALNPDLPKGKTWKFTEHGSSVITVKGHKIKVFASALSRLRRTDGYSMIDDETQNPDIHKIYADIPFNTDIVVTHGPAYDDPASDVPDGTRPLNELDRDSCDYKLKGSKALLRAIERVRPSIVACGHIHNATGYKHKRFMTEPTEIITEVTDDTEVSAGPVKGKRSLGRLSDRIASKIDRMKAKMAHFKSKATDGTAGTDIGTDSKAPQQDTYLSLNASSIITGYNYELDKADRLWDFAVPGGPLIVDYNVSTGTSKVVSDGSLNARGEPYTLPPWADKILTNLSQQTTKQDSANWHSLPATGTEGPSKPTQADLDKWAKMCSDDHVRRAKEIAQYRAGLWRSTASASSSAPISAC